MANLTNPVATLAGFAIKHTTHGLQKSSQELATGIRSVEGNLVGFVVGSSLRSTETVLRAVSSSSGYGINMLSVAENSLTAVKNKVVELRGIIASANTPNGNTLLELDSLYKNGLREAQRLLNQAVFDNRVLFNAATTLNVRVGEKITDTIAVTLSNLTGFQLNFRHGHDVGLLEGNPVAPLAVNLALASFANGSTGSLANLASTAVANNQLLALFNAGIALDADAANGVTSGIIENTAANAIPGFLAANTMVGSLYNTLLRTPGTGDNGGADITAYVLSTGVANANEANVSALYTAAARTGQANQTVADNIMKAMETFLTANLNNVVGQKESLRSAAENLDDLITVVNSGADSYLLTEYEDSSKRFQAELLSLQGAISTIAQGARVASATLDLIKGQ